MLDFLFLITYLSIETKSQMNQLRLNGSVPRDAFLIFITNFCAMTIELIWVIINLQKKEVRNE